MSSSIALATAGLLGQASAQTYHPPPPPGNIIRLRLYYPPPSPDYYPVPPVDVGAPLVGPYYGRTTPTSKPSNIRNPIRR